MAVMRVTVFSRALRATTDIHIAYPLIRNQFGDPEGREPIYTVPGEPLPVLWLIHGGGDNYGDWIYHTRVSDLAERKQLVVVMPSVRDFTSSRSDVEYYSWVSEELPEFVRKILPISHKREKNFIAGLSMGGYLSYRIALNHCQRYSHVGSLSSPLDIVADYRARHANSKTLASADSLIGTDRDIRFLVENALARGEQLPKMFQACGTEDFTWEINVNMRNFFREKGLDLTWKEGPGIHNWNFWSEHIVDLIQWLPLEEKTEDVHKFQKGGN